MQWLSAQDAAEGIFRAGILPAARNHYLTLAGPDALTVREVSAIVRNVYLPARRHLVSGWVSGRGGARPLRYDVATAERVLGFRPAIRLRDGLASAMIAAPAAPPVLRG